MSPTEIQCPRCSTTALKYIALVNCPKCGDFSLLDGNNTTPSKLSASKRSNLVEASEEVYKEQQESLTEEEISKLPNVMQDLLRMERQLKSDRESSKTKRTLD